MRTMRATGSTCLVIALGLGLWRAPAALGQTLIQGRTAFENADSAGARSPGNMVTAGVARAVQAAKDGRAIHPITEQAPTEPGPTGQFVSEAGTAVITQLFDFFFYFSNRFLARAGYLPIFPEQLTPPADGTGTGDTPGTDAGDTTGTATGDTTSDGDSTTGTGDGGGRTTRKLPRGPGSPD